MKEDWEMDVEHVHQALISAREYGLEVEVMYTALRTLKEFPDTSIADALNQALLDWDV